MNSLSAKHLKERRSVVNDETHDLADRNQWTFRALVAGQNAYALMFLALDYCLQFLGTPLWTHQPPTVRPACR